MSPKLRAELDKLMNGKENYLAGKSEAEQIAFLQSMSYRDYLLKVVGVSEDCLFFVKGVWALGLDTCTAWFAFFRHAPGFEGLTLKRPAHSPESEKMQNDDYHLPGGTGDVDRLIIRTLIPHALPPGDVSAVAGTRMA